LTADRSREARRRSRRPAAFANRETANHWAIVGPRSAEEGMNILGCSRRRALRLCFTLFALALGGCPEVLLEDCSININPPPSMVQADAALRAALERQAPSAIPAEEDVLIVGGGFSPAESTGQSTVAAEFFSSKSNKFLLTGALHTSRIGITPVVVKTGALANRLLVAGGVSGRATASSGNVITLDAADLDTVESYNPRTGQFVPTVIRSTRSEAITRQHPCWTARS
jgi:hypothetical protein